MADDEDALQEEPEEEARLEECREDELDEDDELVPVSVVPAEPPLLPACAAV